MSYAIAYAQEADRDLQRLIGFLAARNPDAARRALAVIRDAVTILERFPFSPRAVSEDDPTVREPVIPFGHAGYFVLYKVMSDTLVVILAIRHQREEDYQ